VGVGASAGAGVSGSGSGSERGRGREREREREQRRESIDIGESLSDVPSLWQKRSRFSSVHFELIATQKLQVSHEIQNRRFWRVAPGVL
jgi:hypothetical protein